MIRRLLSIYLIFFSRSKSHFTEARTAVQRTLLIDTTVVEKLTLIDFFSCVVGYKFYFSRPNPSSQQKKNLPFFTIFAGENVTCKKNVLVFILPIQHYMKQ